MGSLARSSKHARSGKYAAQFIRTVTRTGRWRGKKATLDMLGKKK